MIEIQLDKPRKVEFTMRALRQFQMSTGKSLLLGQVSGDFDENTMVEMTYAGLIGGDKNTELTKDDVGDKLTIPIFLKVLKEMSVGIKTLSEGLEVEK